MFGTKTLKVVMLTDVSVGYGTPQNLRLAESLCRELGAAVHMFEPDQTVRPQINVKERMPGCDVTLKRVFTTGNLFTQEGRIEFAQYVAPLIEELAPDILVISGLYRLPVLDLIDHSGMVKIFYCLEEVVHRHSYIFPLIKQCDIILFPEENRRRIYLERIGFEYENKSTFIIYNTNNNKIYMENIEKNDRNLYAGSFHKEITFGWYFLDEEINRIPIDIYGIIDGFPLNEKKALLNSFKELGGVRFRGYFETNEAFFRMISQYLYSIIIWNPDTEDRYYAAPNKLFDALSCGVPLIAAPHPQCVEIIRKYRCGILMDDWSLKSFKQALHTALRAAKSDYYAELVQNCRKAMENDLSWDSQFARIKGALDVQLARKKTR